MALPPVPVVAPSAGCAGTGRELSRFGDLSRLDAFVLGPLGSAPRGPADHLVHLAPVAGGLVHSSATAVPVESVLIEHLPWLRARGVRVTCALRGGSAAELADVAARLRRSLDLACVHAVEVDLTQRRTPAAGIGAGDEPWAPLSADPQDCLRTLSRVREQLPRDLHLVAKLGVECPDLVGSARAAVGGGATALLLSGAVPAETDGHWLSGPAVAPVTRGLVRRVRAAIRAGRVPEVPVLAVGGVADLAGARHLLAAGADGLQVGTALFSQPWLLWELTDALSPHHASQRQRPRPQGAPR